jgi:hypothetical protein
MRVGRRREVPPNRTFCSTPAHLNLPVSRELTLFMTYEQFKTFPRWQIRRDAPAADSNRLRNIEQIHFSQTHTAISANHTTVGTKNFVMKLVVFWNVRHQLRVGIAHSHLRRHA